MQRSVLNVGGNNRNIPLPDHFRGWRHLLLDIDPRGAPDICCDARELCRLEPGQFDAIYCSHNLEHYYRHDGLKVLEGFRHVLKPEGFAHIRVPDLQQVFEHVLANRLDVDDVLYTSPAGPILVNDVIYGWHVEIERSGQDFFAHKTGFTPKSLLAFLRKAGFPHVWMGAGGFEIGAYAFPAPPSEYARFLLELDGEP